MRRSTPLSHYPIITLKKRIVFHFMPDGGGWPVARIHHSFTREGKQLFANALDKGIEITAGHIRSSDAFIKQHVAGNDEPFFAAIKRKAGRGMAGGEQHFEGGLSENQVNSRFDIGRRHGGGLDIRYAVHLADLGEALQYRQLAPVDFQSQAPGIGYEFISENMVEVAMGIDQPDGFEIVFLYKSF